MNKTNNIELLRIAFEKMMKYTKVELTKEARQQYNMFTGRWLIIRDIDCDGDITLQDDTHTSCSGMSINDIKL